MSVAQLAVTITFCRAVVTNYLGNLEYWQENGHTSASASP